MKFLLILLTNLFICNCLHLSPFQINLIIDLVKNPRLTINQRKYINKVLYTSYEKYAVKKAVEFKKFHIHKCKNILIDDLILSSKVGLFKSIKKYNGNSSFTYFSDFYIKGELFKTLTEYYSISNVPKKIRIQNKGNYTRYELRKYKKQLNPILVSYPNYWQFDKYKNSYNINNVDNLEKLERVWQLINNLDLFTKKIFYLKYDVEFNKLRSNKIISELLCCSEENIRIKIKKIKNDTDFKQKLLEIDDISII
jgi:hypothetical protein